MLSPCGSPHALSHGAMPPTAGWVEASSGLAGLGAVGANRGPLPTSSAPPCAWSLAEALIFPLMGA